jgi:regulator of sirC expression with transglutaminase-like and TPR domain
MQVPQPDLESGAFVLALYLHPELNIPRYQGILDSFAEEARLCLRDAVGIERAYRLAEFISDDLGFTGNQRDYYNPDNSCLDWVIDNRTGIPVSLGVIYLILAARLRIPSFGVNMPAHFLVKYEDDGAEVFIDLFHKRMLSRSDCIRLLYHMEIEPRPKYLEATTERQILTRMLRNLTAIASETVRYAPWLT